MTEFIVNFHFLRPWWLLAVIFPIIGWFRFFSGFNNVSAWEAVCDKKLLDFLLIKGSSRQRRLAAGLILTGMLGAIISLAGPTWQKKYIPVFLTENPVMFLLNLSSDMNADDVTPNRLTRAKYAISDLLKSVDNADSGLIVYTEEPFLISPLTVDKKVIDNLLAAVTLDIMPENGDRLYRALDYAVLRFNEAQMKEGNIVVLAADVGQDFNLAIISAAAAYAKGFRVNVVNVGAKTSEKLKMIAEKGGGLYVDVLTGLNQLAQNLNKSNDKNLKEGKNEKEIWEDGGYWLLFLPLICTLYFFRHGIFMIFLFWGLSTTSAQAGFFLNHNQEGIKAFQNQEFQQAAQKFDLPAWKASSYYRLGDFENAYKYFAGKDVESLYNQGNALAKSGKIEEAIKKYEQVLEIQPNHEDAKFNLEYLKQQQKQQQSGGQSDNQNQNEKNNNQNQNNNQNTPQNKTQQQSSDAAKQEQQSPENQNDASEDNQQQQQLEQKNNNSDKQSQNKQTSEEQKNKLDQQTELEKQINEKENNKKEYNEALQAREQQFRDIPEDAGGLLRAFIRKEYLKNRYKDDK